MLLEGKNALITGSNRGIGKATLETFAKEGCKVIWAHARTWSDEFTNTIQSISSEYGTEIYPIYFDLTDTDSLKKEIKEIVRIKQNIDILVNNAGVAHGGLFQMTPISQIKEVFETNLYAGMEITQLILKKMSRQKSGSIVNLASISGIDLKSGNSAYGVSKAAVIAWTKTLAAELGSYNIRVNAVAPGLTDTRMATLMEKHAGEEMVMESTMSRLAQPEEIANVVSYLASDKASFINGQVIRIDGGRR